MEEYLEVINEEGITVGLEARSRCHGDPSLAHRSVHVFVINAKGELFLQKRSLSKDVQPGKWDTSVGGHLKPGEGYEAGALRELEEELGVSPRPGSGHGPLRPVHDYVWRTSIETEHVRTFMLRYDGPFRLQEEEIDEGRFWSREELSRSVGHGILTPNPEEELIRLGIVTNRLLHDG